MIVLSADVESNSSKIAEEGEDVTMIDVMIHAMTSWMGRGDEVSLSPCKSEMDGLLLISGIPP